MVDVIHGAFEWDEDKAASNLSKHGVTFTEAATVFEDPLVVIMDDGSGSERVVAIGFTPWARVLSVVHVERGERIRIISARRATAAETRIYRNG